MAKRSKLAITTLVLGIVSLAAWVLAIILGNLYPAPPGHFSPAVGKAGAVFTLLMLTASLFGPAAVLVVASLSIIILIRSKGQLNGIVFIVIGVALAAVPFILSELAEILNFFNNGIWGTG